MLPLHPVVLWDFRMILHVIMYFIYIFFNYYFTFSQESPTETKRLFCQGVLAKMGQNV